MKMELRCPCADRMSVMFFCLETKRCLKLISLELKSIIPTRCTLLSSHSVALLLEGNLVMDYDDDDCLIGKKTFLLCRKCGPYGWYWRRNRAPISWGPCWKGPAIRVSGGCSLDDYAPERWFLISRFTLMMAPDSTFPWLATRPAFSSDDRVTLETTWSDCCRGVYQYFWVHLKIFWHNHCQIWRGGTKQYLGWCRPWLLGTGVALDWSSLSNICVQVVLPLLQARFDGFKHPTLKASQPVDYDINYYDGSPIVGRHPIQGHIWMACGFRGLGAQMAPAVARGLMEMVYDQGFETIDLSRFAFDRILTGARLEENFLTRHKETEAMMENMA